MSNYKDVDIRCPYFINLLDKDIRCEGCELGTTINTRFARLNDRKDYIELYCSRYPNHCLICKALDEKYEEAKNEG